MAEGEGEGLGVFSPDSGDTAWTGHRSLGLESLLRKVGGPVGVRAGFWMGGGLADVGAGDGGRCFPPGEGGRVRGLCLWKVKGDEHVMIGRMVNLLTV